jgi:hypothetical protein
LETRFGIAGGADRWIARELAGTTDAHSIL